MKTRLPGQIKCPMEGCETTRNSLDGIRAHLIGKHDLSCRDAGPIIDRMKPNPGGDWDQFKKDFEKLEASKCH